MNALFESWRVFTLYKSDSWTAAVGVTTSAAARTGSISIGPSTGSLPCFNFQISNLQALTHQVYLPPYLCHPTLHALHLPAQVGCDGPLLPPLDYIALLQFSVAIMLGLILSDEQRPTAHGTQLSPVAAALIVRLRVLPQHLLPTALMGTELPLIQTAGDVEVLVRKRESGPAALLCISTLRTQYGVVSNSLFKC